MNFKLLSKVLGLLLLLVAVAMMLCEFYDWTDDLLSGKKVSDLALMTSAGITVFFAGILLYIGRGSGREVLRKEAIAIVGLGWLLSALAGSIPFMLCEPGLSFSAAFFESASGFTTTGSSVITDLSAFPGDIILWRSTTQWLGGMGILVLFVALLTMLGVGSKALFQNESSAQLSTSFYTKIQHTALSLWKIYLLLTALCTLGLVILGLSFSDALMYTFATMSTGGFAPTSAGVAGIDNFLVYLWITLFMIFGGTNFILLTWFFRKNFRRVWKDEEFRLYLFLLALAALIVTFDLKEEMHYKTWFESFVHSSFQVTSIMTTTGFASADFDKWPTLSKYILLFVMLVGGCAGSTAGSIKVSRWLIFARTAGQQIVNSFRPSQVLHVKMNGKVLSEDVKSNAIFFIALSFFIVGVSILLVSIFERKNGHDMITIISSVPATFCNIGPGFAVIGPYANFSAMTDASLIFLSFLMILGRLELFALLALFVPALWRKY
ncbi:MAG: TrkH family potassium uptake protein [Chthoniobacterales bacterium]